MYIMGTMLENSVLFGTTVNKDNAKPQVGDHAVAAFGRWGRINVLRQPARSPDVNILDLSLIHI